MPVLPASCKVFLVDEFDGVDGAGSGGAGTGSTRAADRGRVEDQLRLLHDLPDAHRSVPPTGSDGALLQARVDASDAILVAE